MYTIKLFDLDKRDWVYLTIDDYIPCRYENDYSNVPFRTRSDGVKVYNAAVPPTKKLKPLFAIPNGNQMWAALLEKAVAKFVGTYAQIAGGHEPFAMIAFTGFPQVYQYKRVPTNEAKTEAKVGEWERGWAQWAGRTSPSCGYRPTLEKLTFRNDEFFPKLLEYDRLNYMMAASIVCYAPPKTGDEFIRPDGLVLGHAYSLLAVEDFGSVRLVKLRNPHGRGSPEHPTEWNGRWSDASPEWDSHPDINNSVGHERVLHDGIFWMEYSDFVSVFDKVLILPYPMSQPRGALSSIRRAKLRASMRSVARASKDVAGIALEDLTHIDQVVTAIHLMSIKPYDPYLNAPDWVKQDQTTLNRWAQEKLGIKPPNSS
jgi:calpain-15